MKKLIKRIGKPVVFGTILIFLILSSCQEDKIKDIEISKQTKISPMVVFNEGGDNTRITDEEDKGVRTILGRKRGNPFTTRNMVRAHNNIYSNTKSSLPATDLYVKFTPSNYEDLYTLAESDLEFMDFPLDFEVTKMGDYYFEPQYDGDLPELYTVIPTNYTQPLPSVPMEVIDEIILDNSDPAIIREAFRITPGAGNVEDYILPDDPCDEVRAGGESSDCGGGGLGGGTGSAFTVNQCGCTVYSNARKPGGCVNVEDTQLGMVGVRRVKVIWWNGWFSIKKTETNDDGCWRISHKEYGKAYMWIKFKNDRAKIRALNDWKIWRYLFAVKDYVGKLNGGTYNNIEVNYNNTTAENSQGKRYWIAATTNNALHEFFDYAAQDNILPPDTRLQIALSTWGDGGTGGAPMLHQGLNQSIMYNLVEWVLFPLKATYVMELFKQVAPDITYGYDGNTASDRIKSTLYHEFAHASHFRLVGNAYWDKIRYHEVANTIAGNGAYGSPGNFAFNSAPGRVAITESWGEHIGLSYTSRTYDTPANLDWIRRLELRRFESGFIPEGLHFDLLDNNATNGLAENPAITDNVRGFTNNQLYYSISKDVHTIGQFRDKLRQNHLAATPNTTVQLDALVASYDW